MVTRLQGGRGQISIKGGRVDDAWEALVKGAAARNGQSFGDFVVDTTTAAAQAILKGQPVVPAALPAARMKTSPPTCCPAWPSCRRISGNPSPSCGASRPTGSTS